MTARACPACSSRSHRPAGSANGFALERCSGCGTLFTAVLPEPEAAMDYAGYYREANLRIPEFVERRLEEVAGEFGPYRRLNTWLDVGCGAGALMRAARARKWTAVGTEVAKGAVEAVRAQGFEVHLGDLAELPLDEESFDVVSLVEVLEHVDEPERILRDARRLLRPGGAMYVTTPHGRGISARLLGERWSAVAPPEHLQLYSAGGLERALSRVGLRVRSMRAHAVNPNELVGALRRRGPGTPGERVESGYALNESLNSRRSGAALKSAANGVLSVLRLGDALKARAERPA